ncbi:MAG: BRCT domain-containing protein [Pseudomonadales bacterium]|jgi:NAD-dependent DNA ligase|nr:BRCT domain-containing protein [Pseudomonadales bacterium]MDP7144018.1 BRCT domain-containing protein [Pseudomonadales bacterium]MDP7357637.1 BRCT domain-containing protein [Pseudomonadales bacterium]MDP7598082.1 BRCT domain-containing protein [Pseudomonadales bacterium]HJN50803.1 BRCT domain-containing protein [Pseudomonadales bacterium]|tara:strand:+ start:180 stop:800 length:621 start_codon:yes stop_codon:yes gene_type:complete
MGNRQIETSTKYLSRIQDRLIDELIGISRGVIADGIVDESEVIFLGQWIENHREVADRWPANVLYARLVEMLKDGVLDADEQRELLETLMDITGGNSVYQESSRSTTLPVTQPQPEIVFEGSVFCLTGRFVFGSKMECEEIIVDLGGVVIPAPTTDTDYLLIGEVGSPDWIHSTFGRSIEKAIELQGHGHPISILSEEHWVNQLPE